MVDRFEELDLADLVADPNNARVHTPRTIGTIVDLIHEVGAGRGIVIDENNVVLAGNGAREAALEAGVRRVVVVEQDKDVLVAVRRVGLTDLQKTKLAIGDNRAGEFSTYDPAVLQGMADAGVDMTTFFTSAEWAALLASGPKPLPAKGGPIVTAHDVSSMEVVFEGHRIVLTPEQDVVLDDLMRRWIEVYGSESGVGAFIAEAIIGAVTQEVGYA